MLETTSDILQVITPLLLILYALHNLYLLGRLDESRRHVREAEGARDRWKKRATDAEGAAGSLRHAYEDCKRQRKQEEKVLAEACRALRQRAIRIEVGTDASKPRQ